MNEKKYQIKKWIWIIGFSTFLGAVLLLIWGHYTHENISMSNFHVSASGDRADKGNSKITFQKLQEGIKVDIQFDTGFAYPYANLSWDLRNDDQNCLDLGDRRHIELVYQSHQSLSFTIQVNEWLSNWSEHQKGMNFRPWLYRLWVDQAAEYTKIVPLQELSVPDWWYVDYPLAPHQIDPGQMQSCQIGFSFNGKPGEKQSIIIHHFELAGSEQLIQYSYILLILSIIWLAFWSYHELNRYRKWVRQLENRLELKDNIQEIEPPQENLWKQVKIKIEELWNQEDLQMEVLVQKTGLPAHKISVLIKENTGLPFKTLLNQIRLEKAENLLLHSNEQVSQIALLCGYGHAAHFFRVFKTKHQCSPKEWREKQKNTNGNDIY